MLSDDMVLRGASEGMRPWKKRSPISLRRRRVWLRQQRILLIVGIILVQIDLTMPVFKLLSRLFSLLGYGLRIREANGVMSLS